MNWLRQFLGSSWRRVLDRHQGRVDRIPSTPQTENHPQDDGQAPFANNNPLAEALRRIFATTHRAEENRAFRPVGADGTVDECVEEWFRDGDANVARTRRTKIVTCSGEIVTSEQLQGVCWCGGFDDVIARCQVCSLPLCRLHRRSFTSPLGEYVLCDRHHREALDGLDTWQSLDSDTKPRRMA